MSAIAAIFHLTGGPAEPECLERMTGIIAHRGPDGSGHWWDGPVGLGHRLFQTTPGAAHENQPFISSELRLAITADARVDNRTELRRQLCAKGLEPVGQTDSEILLRAYALWVEECVEHIVGDFAFVIWDARRRRLFFARDALGIKPLLYWCDGELLLIASEPKQIFQHPLPSREVNWAVLGDYLCRNRTEPEETLYSGVRRLPAGHAALAEGENLRIKRFWPVDLGREIRYRNSEQYAEHFRDCLQEAVRCRMQCQAPVGVLLSGGLDSSSVACLANKIRRENPAGCAPLETFSAVYPGLPCDESAFIEAVVRELDVPAHRIPYGEEFHAGARLEVASDFPDVLFVPPSFGQVLYLARWVRERGIRVLLDGLGGDELFVSTPANMADALRQGDLALLLRRFRHARASKGLSAWQLVPRLLIWPLMPEEVKVMVRRVRNKISPPAFSHIGPWMDPAFVSRYRLRERWQERLKPPDVPTRSVGQRHLYDYLTRGYNMVFGLEWADRMTSALSLEYRHPYLDRRLVDFCLAIPEHERVTEETGKFLLRRALRGILPEVIRQRQSKVIFDCLYLEQLTLRQAETIENLFQGLQLEAAGVLAKGEALRLLSRVGQGDWGSVEPVLSILQLELWYNAFLDAGERHHRRADRCEMVRQ
ncbi:MAG: asparagine synthase (glutamine-hydrolyzing) [Acidobacteria bacterium]|nr:asparagine synthase (glutamine-hydrolyzing) [Acidobacteriota bacterium]